MQSHRVKSVKGLKFDVFLDSFAQEEYKTAYNVRILLLAIEFQLELATQLRDEWAEPSEVLRGLKTVKLKTKCLTDAFDVRTSYL